MSLATNIYIEVYMHGNQSSSNKLLFTWKLYHWLTQEAGGPKLALEAVMPCYLHAWYEQCPYTTRIVTV